MPDRKTCRTCDHDPMDHSTRYPNDPKRNPADWTISRCPLGPNVLPMMYYEDDMPPWDNCVRWKPKKSKGEG